MLDGLRTFKVDYYEDARGRAPIIDWLRSLDRTVRARIGERINRLRLGQVGDFKPLGQQLFGLKMHFGPGHRIYFGYLAEKLILLLAGGDKSSQDRDIIKARRYWNEYLRRWS